MFIVSALAVTLGSMGLLAICIKIGKWDPLGWEGVLRWVVMTLPGGLAAALPGLVGLPLAFLLGLFVVKVDDMRVHDKTDRVALFAVAGITVAAWLLAEGLLLVL